MDATEKEKELKKFLKVVTKVEEEDSVLTSEQQIERLTKKGAKFRNLNPFEVLQVDREIDEKELKKKYRKLSFLVHPDKNGGSEIAQKAFEAVNEAYRAVQDDEKMAWVNFIYNEAEEEWPHYLKTKRREAKKKGETIPEDRSEANMKESWRKFLLKQFADKEIEKDKLLSSDSKRKQEEFNLREDEKEKAKRAKVVDEEWKEGREQRMNAWLNFNGTETTKEEKKKSKKSKKEKKRMGFKPPKLKTERR
eukprot:m.137545 g.137545  ORF g.137545 m.137545 type:complete len:250 (-) comp11903_c0_seq1:72-821(-)